MKVNFGRLIIVPILCALCLFFLPSCKSKIKDADIQALINTKLSTAPDLSSVTATVQDGVVTLSGEYKDEAGKTNAENLAKSTAGVVSVVDNATIATPPAAAPVTISADEPLIRAVADATKDYPGVKSMVNEGVITLTGEIRRSDLSKLMQSLNTLKPKKIENKLTIK